MLCCAVLCCAVLPCAVLCCNPPSYTPPNCLAVTGPPVQSQETEAQAARCPRAYCPSPACLPACAPGHAWSRLRATGLLTGLQSPPTQSKFKIPKAAKRVVLFWYIRFQRQQEQTQMEKQMQPQLHAKDLRGYFSRRHDSPTNRPGQRPLQRSVRLHQSNPLPLPRSEEHTSELQSPQ